MVSTTLEWQHLTHENSWRILWVQISCLTDSNIARSYASGNPRTIKNKINKREKTHTPKYFTLDLNYCLDWDNLNYIYIQESIIKISIYRDIFTVKTLLLTVIVLLLIPQSQTGFESDLINPRIIITNAEVNFSPLSLALPLHLIRFYVPTHCLRAYQHSWETFKTWKYFRYLMFRKREPYVQYYWAVWCPCNN